MGWGLFFKLNVMGIKTTITAFVLLLAGIGCLAALVMGKLEKDEFTIAMSSLGAFGAVIIGFLAKDQNKSHTQGK